MYVAQLGRIYPELKEAGVEVLVILGNSITRAERYANIVKAPFPILADPEREVYRIYELEKYFFLIQRTASIFVDQQGVVRQLKRTTSPLVWLQEARALPGFLDSLAPDTHS